MASSHSPHTVVHLLRHAHSDANARGVLAGQLPGIHLSKKGREQADAITQSLIDLGLDSMYVSPMERCWETVEPLIDQTKKIDIFTERALIEMNYGAWCGKKLSLLSKKGLWNEIQKVPSSVRFPDGESFLEMQTRVVAFINALRIKGGVHLLVSHGDVIRVAINHFLGNHLDNFQRLAISPASLSTLVFNGNAVVVESLNQSLSKIDRASGQLHSTLGGGAGRK